MIEILGNLIELYLEPLLRFVGVYIDKETCALKPANVSDKSIVFTYEDKNVVVVKTTTDFNKYREKRDEYEIFNPFLVPRHMTFLANLMRDKLNELVEPIGNKDVPMVYDEDLDEWIIKDDVVTIEDIELYDKVGVFQSKSESGLVEVMYAYIDRSGNPIQPIVKFEAIEPIMAMYGVILEAMKLYVKILPTQLRDTEAAGNNIYNLLSTYEKERKKRGIDDSSYRSLDLSHEDDIYYDAKKWDDIEFRMEPDNTFKYVFLKSTRLHNFILNSPFEDLVNIPNIYEYFHLPELRVSQDDVRSIDVTHNIDDSYDDLILY